MRAARPIAKDEEISVSYIGSAGTRDQLEWMQEHYGFCCSCSKCKLPADLCRKSEERQKRLASWSFEHVSFEKWVINASLPDDLIIVENEGAIKLCEAEMEHLDACYHYLEIVHAYAALADKANYRVWAKKARGVLRCRVGDDFPAISFLENTISDPPSHPRWSQRSRVLGQKHVEGFRQEDATPLDEKLGLSPIQLLPLFQDSGLAGVDPGASDEEWIQAIRTTNPKKMLECLARSA